MSDPASSTPFRHRRVVAFGDVDYARILYYPRWLHYCHEAFEAWWRHALELPYVGVLEQERIGFPTVHVEADYRRPMPYGAEIEISVRPVRVGTSSLVLHYEAILDDGQVAASAEVTTVCVDMDRFASVPIPSDIRRRIACLTADES